MFLYNNKGREILYWRKAYHIEQWFIDNCAGGDRMLTSDGVEVTLTQLKELLRIINIVLESRTEDCSQNYLPCYSEEYEDFYYDTLEHTKKILEKELKDKTELDIVFEDIKYTYNASW